MPLRASTRMTAASAVEAPVAMLRVYCSWPGQSATMKARRRVEKQREVDVALGRAARPRFAGERRQLIVEDQVGVVKQAADQRRLAVVDRAASEEAEQGAVGAQHAGDRVHVRALRNSLRASSS